MKKAHFERKLKYLKLLTRKLETENSNVENHDYLQYRFYVNPVNPGNEILIAILGEQGFESFEENNDGFAAFIKSDELQNTQLLIPDSIEGIEFSFTKTIIPKQNWNETWEKNFHPVDVEGLICIRAHFHAPPPSGTLDIVITPKMSFGTGHHDTTWLMSRYLFDESLNGKRVLDMGCGTAVLAIIAAKKGAKTVMGIDIDEWSIDNAIENCKLNKESGILIKKGDAGTLGNEKFEIILANINRNVLLRDISDRKSTRLNSSHIPLSRMPSSA